MPGHILVIGGGVFGLTAALELRRRGHQVTLADRGPIPSPLAASNDVSKIVRADYGHDVLYTELMETALPRWREWNQRWKETLFHETGFVILSTERMARNSFELSSYETLIRRGHDLERLDEGLIPKRFPQWRRGRFVDGYYNPLGGWAESGRVIAALAAEARESEIELLENARVESLVDDGERTVGARIAGKIVSADSVVVATGTWVGELISELADPIASLAQPIVHFRPAHPEHFAPPGFVPWAADISRTGWYGFSANPDGVVKMSNHGPGYRLDPNGARDFPEGVEAQFRSFVEDALPELAKAEIVERRMCFYADSFDGDYFIDRHPTRAGLVVAGGGSGHAFKFAPVLGELVADTVEHVPNRFALRFGWRGKGQRRTEQARFDG